MLMRMAAQRVTTWRKAMLKKISDQIRQAFALIVVMAALGVMIKYHYDASQCYGVAVMGVVWVECMEKGDA